MDLLFNLYSGGGCIGSGQTADHGRVAVQLPPAGCHGRSHERRRLENRCVACEPWWGTYGVRSSKVILMPDSIARIQVYPLTSATSRELDCII